MELIDFQALEANRAALAKQWNDPAKPFHYLVYDNFFTPEAAEKVLAAWYGKEDKKAVE